jgi:hypothetical protein
LTIPSRPPSWFASSMMERRTCTSADGAAHMHISWWARQIENCKMHCNATHGECRAQNLLPNGKNQII